MNKLFYDVRAVESQLGYVSFLGQTEGNDRKIEEELEETKQMIDNILKEYQS